jgi:hypothetical protein
MSEQHANILKSLETTARDLDTLGWDLPSRLYYLVDDVNDPALRLVGQLPTHPMSDLIAGYEAGARVPTDACGIALAHEAYRHLTFDELLERQPSMLESIKASAERELRIKIDPDEVKQRASDYYHQAMIPRLPMPRHLPPNMRAEIRMVCAVLRDGTLLNHQHTRGTDDHHGQVEPRDVLVQGRIPTAMYLFLSGVRPDGDCPDPFTVVSDYQTVEALSALPTKED